MKDQVLQGIQKKAFQLNDIEKEIINTIGNL